MIILGIETSCDETAIGVLKAENKKFEILSNVVASQVKLHQKYGGVYPFLAKREHQKNLPVVFEKATKGIPLSKIDLIGVTIGPGLEPCLWQGINFAKNLAKKLKLPIVPVNHLEAHILVNFLDFPKNKIFPALCLVVSGGHTLLFLMEKIGKYKIIGQTRDDAAGECLDKTGRLLGLKYPAGPKIEKLAKKYFKKENSFGISLPRPMIYQKNYDFSFAGLKTAVLYEIKKQKGKIKKEYILEMAKEIQQAVIDVLIKKTLRGAREFKVKSIFLGGGVVANENLREQFKEKIKKELPFLKIFFPKKEFCQDNGIMVAVCAFFHRKKAKKKLEKIRALDNLQI